MKDTADSGKMAYDQMIGAGNAEGNKIVQDVVDGLVAQARAIEGVVAALDLTIEVEGSDSLDNPQPSSSARSAAGRHDGTRRAASCRRAALFCGGGRARRRGRGVERPTARRSGSRRQSRSKLAAAERPQALPCFGGRTLPTLDLLRRRPAAGPADAGSASGSTRPSTTACRARASTSLDPLARHPPAERPGRRALSDAAAGAGRARRFAYEFVPPDTGTLLLPYRIATRPSSSAAAWRAC